MEKGIVRSQQHRFLGGLADMRNLPYPIDILRRDIYCGCPILDNYELTCGSEIATVQALCGTCCMSVHLHKKIRVMDEVKQGRRNHLIFTLRKCRNMVESFLLIFTLCSPHRLNFYVSHSFLYLPLSRPQ